MSSKRKSSRPHLVKPRNLEQQVIRQVKHNLKAGITPSENCSIEEGVEQCQQYLKEVLYYHYILIVIDDFVQTKVITDYVLQYPVKAMSLELKAISDNLNVVNTLDEDFAYMEILSLADRLKPIAKAAGDEFERSEKIYPRFLAVVTTLTKQLPSEEDVSRSLEEKCELVIKAYAIGKMVGMILDEGKPEVNHG